ncbi:UDP-glucose 4-epimerase [Corynebacterium imitans]|uniref:UDP-glucose 4-epimerase n=1 Tax=Corynebacterium imitans TaxID=156978 RepID=A0A076NN84_9CORY|nr:UDP-glucose 4-epimerase GalE [Corynebacterium imitans]AIJ33716.1 UDP-glucose 4-epimerase [Corynebacterium imitans]SNV74368.1 UDP-glucose 4-epimerase [Corynebacterium imitans]
MKLVVTGGAGYVGSVCAAVLLEGGHEVIVVDDFSTGNREAVPEGATLVEGRINDVIDEVLRPGDIDGVLHFAARSLVGESVDVPDEYWRDNFEVSLYLLNAMRRHGVRSLVFSSTAATYGEPENVPITEDAPTRPTNPYGATKLAIDYAISSYCKAYGIAATSLRYFNVAGAYNQFGELHRTETHLIPIVLQVALGQRDAIKMFGDDWPTADGTCVRDYIHVRDLADAHVLALQANTPGTHAIYNLGSGDGYSVREVVEMCREVTGHEIPAEVAPRRAGDPAVLIASSEKIKRELGWNPTRTDLRRIVEDAWAFTAARTER